MKQSIEALLRESLESLKQSSHLSLASDPQIEVRPTRHSVHGDFSTNLALAIASSSDMSAQEIAQALVERLPESEAISRVKIADPGFINFYVLKTNLHGVIPVIEREGDQFGHSNLANNRPLTIICRPMGASSLALTIQSGRVVTAAGSIANALEAVGFDVCRTYGVREESMAVELKRELTDIGVNINHWLVNVCSTAILESVVEKLEKSGHMYSKDGELWFRSTDFGDEKDWVFITKHNQLTASAADIVHLVTHVDAEVSQVLFLFGEEDGVSAKSLYAACDALELDRGKLEILTIQSAHLSPSRQSVLADTGEANSLSEWQDDVGLDAVRYFCLMRPHQQRLKVNLDLARLRNRDNPLFNVQYAHARICSVERQARDKGWTLDRKIGHNALEQLNQRFEAELMILLGQYPECVAVAATERAPNRITMYLQELANGLNRYYEAHKWLIEDERLRQSRMCLILAARQVLKNGLGLLDVSAPEVL